MHFKVLPSANLLKLFFFVNDKKTGVFAPSEASLIFESKAGVMYAVVAYPLGPWPYPEI
jgi:hypothetical protein